MSGKHVCIEISPSRLEVSVITGGVVTRSAAAAPDREDWTNEWPAGLDSISARLKKLIAEAGAKGLPARIFYTAPGAGCSVTSCPVGLSAESAGAAALLSLAAQCTFAIESSPSSTFSIGSDRSKTNPQRHTLAIADSDETVTALWTLAREVGVKPIGVVPAEAIELISAARLALERGAGGAVLWVGDHSSVLAAGSAGRLVFVRALAVGLDSLRAALLRPLRVRRDSIDAVTLTPDEARLALAKTGIPTAIDIIDVDRGITGAAVLPALQPVLQRMCVEIKQSLRFGLSDEERSAMSIVLAGPGSAVNRLAEVLDGQSGTKVVKAEGAGAKAGAHVNWPDRLSLRPLAQQHVQRINRVRVAVVAGVALAGGLMAFQWQSAQDRLGPAEARLTQLTQTAEQIGRFSAEQARAAESRVRLAQAEARIRSGLGDTADWSGVLRVLGETTSDKVRLTSVEMRIERGDPQCSVRGVMQAGKKNDPAAVITKYIDDLSALPIVRNVRLGATQRTASGSSQTQKFELGIRLLGLPVSGLTEHQSGHASVPVEGSDQQ